jgi:hypothetical protein
MQDFITRDVVSRLDAGIRQSSRVRRISVFTEYIVRLASRHRYQRLTAFSLENIRSDAFTHLVYLRYRPLRPLELFRVFFRDYFTSLEMLPFTNVLPV